jgi:hypothetical protein
MKIFVATLLLVMLCGCGHNAIQYSDGIGFETTFRPDTGNFGINFRYGKILSVAVRENTEVEMTGDGKGGSETDKTNASASGSVKIKVGKQITGYYVDALKAGAKTDDLTTYTK